MIVERVESEGLAHYSYFIGSGTTAVVIDPRRDCEVYLDLARREGMNIAHVLETHRNEDYVVGSLELAERTGARVLHGPGSAREYGETVGDQEKTTFGDVELEALYTPGHTLDHVCYALRDRETGKEPVSVFTGDCLFVGDVGRTDLLGESERERLSGLLYDSLHSVLLRLDDGCIVKPAHGAGSVCGGDISERTETTIGIERRQNPLLRMSQEVFVRYKMAERLEIPAYFSRMEVVNQARRVPMSGVPVPKSMTPGEFAAAVASGGLVLDVRMPHSWAGSHIPDSLNIWLDGLAPYAGAVLPSDRDILLVTDDDRQVERAMRMLVRMGFDSTIGYLKGGMVEWYRQGRELRSMAVVGVSELKTQVDEGMNVFILDPRPRKEWAEVHLANATNIFVGDVEKQASRIPRDRPVASMCSVGLRGSIAASILERNGYDDVAIVLGGVSGWEAQGFPVERQMEK
ncbi:MAG: MBL fold metallo-hydrolase [Methanomassiliicoccales archaeon]|nr:MBL fold metallo-hydrolase [Methanomassiliicoccales archaeon]